MCGDDEVIDVAGPRLSAVMSTWEYVLLRVQQEDEGNSSAPLIPRILNEVTALVSKVSAMAARHLHVHQTSVLHQQEQPEQDLEAYQLANAQTARLIGLQCGTYFISKDDRKLLTAEHDAAAAASLSSPAVEDVGASPCASTTSAVGAETTTTTNGNETTETPLVVEGIEQEEDAVVAESELVVVNSNSVVTSSSSGGGGGGSSLWEELEEASSHLTGPSDSLLDDGGNVVTGSIDPLSGGGGVDGNCGDGVGDGGDDDDELMQVDDIVNQAVEGQTGSQAPSPL